MNYSDFSILAIFLLVTTIQLDQQDSVRTGKNHWLSGWKNSTEAWRKSIYDWYTGNLWQGRSWIVKNVLTFLIDGWHFHKFFIMLETWGYIGYLFGNIWIGVVCFGVQGLIFNILNKR